MRQVAGNMGGVIEPTFKEGLPNLYCGIFSIVLLFLYLISREIKLRDKLCALFLLIFFNASFIIRQLDYIWHGFHFTNMIPYRFSFLYSFVVLYMAYRAWTLRHTFRPWHILLACLLAGGILCCSEEFTSTVPVELFGSTYDIRLYLIYNSVFLALYLLSMLYGTVQVELPEEPTEKELRDGEMEKKRLRRVSAALLLAVMGVELIGNLTNFGLCFTGTGISNYPKGTEKAASVIRYMHEREEDNLFFRADTTHSQTLNDGALNNYNGITAFASSVNVKTTEFIKALGFSAKNTYNRYLFEESSPVANLFLGLKYMIERDGKDKTSTYFKDVNTFGNVSLLENTAYLPLGFLAERELARIPFDGSVNAFTFQNDLFTAATGIMAEVWHLIPRENLTILSNGVSVTEKNETGSCQYTASENNSNVIYSYIADRDGFVCTHLNLPKRNDYYVSINGVELFKETISLDQMMAVGDVVAGDVIEIRIVCDAGENSTMKLSTAILDPEVFQQGYEILNASTLELTRFENTRISGIIQCNRNGLLYTSIPQNGNWTVTVDGVPAEIYLVGDCMVAVELTEGIHRVELRYQNRAFAIGWKISFGCAAILLLLVQYFYKPDWKHLYKPAKKGKYQR